MRGTRRAAIVVGAFAVAALGCGPDRPAEPVAEAPAAGMPVDAPPPVTPEVLARLEEQYPVLREEPAPEPQPNGDADPAQVPESGAARPCRSRCCRG
jgi:hypothetical protein